MTEAAQTPPLFSRLEGLRGENMSSAILAHLLAESESIRNALFQLISEQCSVDPLPNRQGPKIETEKSVRYSLDDGKEGIGRIDIFIRTKTCLIGIENKFFAHFTESQLERYLKALKSLAEDERNEDGTKPRILLVTLTPSFRVNEAKSQLSLAEETNVTCFMKWETLIDRIRDECSNDELSTLSNELREYITHYIGAIPNLEDDLPKLLYDWKEKGTSLQRRFLDRFIWSLLDDCVKEAGKYRYGSAKHYYGWYLYPKPEQKSNSIWIGFMENDHANGQKAALLFGVTEPENLRDACKGCSLFAEDDKGQTGRWTYFRIPFDSLLSR